MRLFFSHEVQYSLSFSLDTMHVSECSTVPSRLVVIKAMKCLSVLDSEKVCKKKKKKTPVADKNFTTMRAVRLKQSCKVTAGSPNNDIKLHIKFCKTRRKRMIQVKGLALK